MPLQQGAEAFGAYGIFSSWSLYIRLLIVLYYGNSQPWACHILLVDRRDSRTCLTCCMVMRISGTRDILVQGTLGVRMRPQV